MCLQRAGLLSRVHQVGNPTCHFCRVSRIGLCKDVRASGVPRAHAACGGLSTQRARHLRAHLPNKGKATGIALRDRRSVTRISLRRATFVSALRTRLVPLRERRRSCARGCQGASARAKHAACCAPLRRCFSRASSLEKVNVHFCRSLRCEPSGIITVQSC